MQEIAIVQCADQQKGQAIRIRRAPTNWSRGTRQRDLLGIVVRAVAHGTSPIKILEVNARDSQQKKLHQLLEKRLFTCSKGTDGDFVSCLDSDS